MHNSKKFLVRLPEASCRNVVFVIYSVGVLFFSSSGLFAQGVGEYLGGEDVLYAETKQVNQFFSPVQWRGKY